MTIDFRNTNTLWSSLLSQTLKRLGLTKVIICPGSRSTPLTVAFAQTEGIEAIPVLDERSAAFFALGIAKRSGLPVALVCTSGTAGANFYSAVIEAKESRIPLLILTADRPAELRDCHSGQTIDQIKLYGHYPNWQAELAVPLAEIGMLKYLRQTIIHAWERSLFPSPGPVHLNIPFRDPLAPIPQPDTERIKSQLDGEDFLAFCQESKGIGYSSMVDQNALISRLQTWQKCDKGIIIAGVAQPDCPKQYCQAIANLSKTLKWPVLAEGLSPLRNYAQLNPYLISTYDLILRHSPKAQQLAPEIVIQIGNFPTSKILREWVDTTQPQRWVIDPSFHNLDPLHGKTIHLRLSVEQLLSISSPSTQRSEVSSDYLQKWCDAEAKVRVAIDQSMTTLNKPFEGKAAWLLSQTLPPNTPVFIANSMPVRDVEFFWTPNHFALQPFFNRGANGIDGTLSTALGIAYRAQSSVMLTGDLALLHDTNGFLLRKHWVGHLTIILINNNGGGIFEMLPIAKFDPPFEAFFATPQDIDFAALCATYNIEHQLITDWEELKSLLNPLPTEGMRVLELRTDRRADARWRRENLRKFSQAIA